MLSWPYTVYTEMLNSDALLMQQSMRLSYKLLKSTMPGTAHSTPTHCLTSAAVWKLSTM